MIRLFRIIFFARKKGLLRLRKAEAPARLDCIGGACGLCCEVLGGGVVVTEEEAAEIGESSLIRSGKNIDLKSTGNVCSLLKDKACSCYAVRPQGCREYPWYNIDGQLYYDAGCPGMKFDHDERPAIHSLKSFEHYLPGMPKLFQKIIQIFLAH